MAKVIIGTELKLNVNVAEVDGRIEAASEYEISAYGQTISYDDTTRVFNY